MRSKLPLIAVTAWSTACTAMIIRINDKIQED